MSGPKAAATVVGGNPKAASALMRLVAKASPAELQELIAEGVLSKAGPEHGLLEGQISPDPHEIHDLWEGPPDQMPRLEHITRGASGARPGGAILTGTPQAASGDGAVRMQDIYSVAIAAQNGVTDVTTRFGDAMTHMSTMAKAINAINRKMELLGTVVSKSLEAKAAAEEKDDEDEKKEKEAAKAKAKAAAEDNADMDEDDKAASKLVLKAKTTLAAARKEAIKGLNALASDDTATQDAAFKSARVLVKAASLAFNGVRALAPTHAEIAALDASFKSLAKALPVCPADNQDIWPDGGYVAVGKAEDKEDDEEVMEKAKQAADAAAKAKAASTTSSAGGIDPAAFQAGLDKVAKAVEGVSMLQTDMKGFMTMFAGQSATGIPPVFNLAKADPTAFVTAKREEISKAISTGMMTRDDGDKAYDIAGLFGAAAEGKVPEGIATARLKAAPAAVKAVFQQAA